MTYTEGPNAFNPDSSGYIVSGPGVVGLEHKQKLDLRLGLGLFVNLVLEGDGTRGKGDSSGRVDGLLWYKDLGQHINGEFSMAVIQANSLLEDQSQLESGPLSFLDSGLMGPSLVYMTDMEGQRLPALLMKTSSPILRLALLLKLEEFEVINGLPTYPKGNVTISCTTYLSFSLPEFATEHQEISESVIRKAFSATEEGFLSLVKKQWLTKPQIASVGSCCLAGIICNGLLYIANVGDSRAVLGGQKGPAEKSQLFSYQQSTMLALNLQSSTESLSCQFRLPQPFIEPILSSEPSISVHKIRPEDQFIIFASDGLWEHLSNQEAVNIVNNYPRNGIARKLVKTALQEAAKKREMRYSDLKKIDRGVRRHFHDDITVVVVFLDPLLIKRSSSSGCPFSIKGGVKAPAPAAEVDF
ncbi:putative protein phosphatase 2C 60 [Vitis vinifera]|uniref:PPM-type phosphatase domain-containing protein n=1 Tax=Vitis vinifera TaxID=29760 RepID=A0A438DWC9_VITVI|nr:putative protein phosphatase 2C 60 [Vitis vinifera]